MEFPTTNLYELESRVFTDHWSIPYKREESLGKCLIASTCLARHGKTMFVGNENLCFCIKLNALLLRNCVGGMFLFAPLGVFHMLLFWTLMLHGSICMSVVTANFFFFHAWAWDKYVNPTSPSLPGLADADENCKRFIDRCMPEAFKKVSKEDPEIYSK